MWVTQYVETMSSSRILDLKITGTWHSIRAKCACTHRKHFLFLLYLLFPLLEILGLGQSLTRPNLSILILSFHLLLADLTFCSFPTIVYLVFFCFAFFQSESQDQVFLRWTSGETATMHILVVHAMVILLTLGPPQG